MRLIVLGACLLLFFGSIVKLNDYKGFYVNNSVEIKRVELNKLVTSVSHKSDIEKVKLVNDYFNNNIMYVADDLLWGKGDYWATPLEMMVKGGGDCEDYAIAKYMVLKSANIDVNKMRLSYVISTGNEEGKKQSHMVLEYFDKGKDPFVLDNQEGDVKRLSSRYDLISVYSFNHYSLWVVGNVKRDSSYFKYVSRWKDLLVKMEAEIL